ncbi:hypothetical protein AB836_01500 [Rickettsiales bacterium (ex Bugula neritina AB1)]|nr:hypothetical protein AB836_01500 [Rickettsiales bacterium (ex Bugula neritina AB1)]
MNSINIKFTSPLCVLFKKREKRFFSYFQDINDNIYKAHCINTGKMADILVEDSNSIITPKTTGTLSYQWEAIKINNTWIGVNTWTPNNIVELMINKNMLKKYGISGNFKRDRKIGDYKPDFINENTIIEVKNVHWKINDTFFFPDCPTERGLRQLKNMIHLKQKYNKNIIIIYIIQRHDGEKMTISKIHQEYYNNIIIGKNLGIKILAFTCKIELEGIYFHKEIDFFI